MTRRENGSQNKDRQETEFGKQGMEVNELEKQNKTKQAQQEVKPTTENKR